MQGKPKNPRCWEVDGLEEMVEKVFSMDYLGEEGFKAMSGVREI